MKPVSIFIISFLLVALAGISMKGQTLIYKKKYYKDKDFHIKQDTGKSKENENPASCDDSYPCTEDRLENGKCVHPVKSGYCLIDGVCYARNTRNPKNMCLVCDDLNSPAFWGTPVGSACSDGSPCTHHDSCKLGGICSGIAYTCDDSKFCTSNECDGAGACKFDILTGHCLIGGVCYQHLQKNPKKSCEVCRSDISKTMWIIENPAACGN